MLQLVVPACYNGRMTKANQLTSAFVRNCRHSGRVSWAERHGDGGGLGLMLNVQPSGSKSWVQFLTVRGKRRSIGLGGYPAVSLKEAREKAQKNQQVARKDGDPRQNRRRVPRFRDAAAAVIELQSSEWTCPKSRKHWESSLAIYAFPVIGDMRVDRIEPSDVLAVLEPMWGSKRETAQRVRQRIEAVMRWAVTHGHRTDNPADKTTLSGLPRRRSPVKHHCALPYADVPAAIRKIRYSLAWTGTKLAFEFLVLTAARSGEVRGAVWDEIDFDNAVWTIPDSRMKAGIKHRVPLAPRALEVLTEARELTNPPVTSAHRDCQFVFPSLRAKMLSDSTISKLVRENNIPGVPHGFRSSFRDWAAERTTAPHAVMEAALAHRIPSAVERAYARSDLFDRRRALMEDWATFVQGGAGP